MNKFDLIMFAALAADVPFSLTVQIPTDGGAAFWRARLGVAVFDGVTADNVLEQVLLHIANNYRGKQPALDEDDE